MTYPQLYATKAKALGRIKELLNPSMKNGQDQVRQEFHGWVLAHYAVRWLMHQAATDYAVTARSLSFTANMALLTRAQPQSGTSPSPPPAWPRKRKRWFKALLREVARLRCVQGKGLHKPRMLKRRHSPYARHDRKEPSNVNVNFWPQPLGPLPVTKRKIYGKSS